MQTLSRKYPRYYHFAIGLLMASAGAVVLWLLLGRNHTMTAFSTCWLVAINVVTLAYYGLDKNSAGRGQRRVPVLVLHGFGAVGGSPAALIAMSLFRHKTVDGHFRIMFWCVVVLQTLGSALLWKFLWPHG